jgi:hypothetical protein
VPILGSSFSPFTDLGPLCTVLLYDASPYDFGRAEDVQSQTLVLVLRRPQGQRLSSDGNTIYFIGVHAVYSLVSVDARLYDVRALYSVAIAGGGRQPRFQLTDSTVLVPSDT